MANWWESTNLTQVANEFARAFKQQGVVQSDGGGTSGTTPLGSRTSDTTNKDTKATETHTRAVKDNTSSIKSWSSSLSSFVKFIPNSMDTLRRAINTPGITKASDHLRSALSSGAEAGTLLRREFDMIKLGVTVETLNQFSQASRQAQIAMGGYNKWVGEITSAQRDLFDRLGSTSKALEFSATALERFGHSGLQPTLEQLNAMTPELGKWGKSLLGSMDDLQKLGVTYEQSQQILQSVTEDEDVRNRLRAAGSEKERKAILQGQMARMREFKMLGMTTEQARLASKALEQLGGKKPLDRFKQAAKAQAALSAMGVEGADVVADTIRKGARATDEERARMAEVLGGAQDIMAEAAMGGIGREFTFATLMDKAGLNDLIGKTGPFSTKLDENVAVNEKQLEAMKTVSQAVGGLEGTMKNAVFTRDMLANLLEDNALVRAGEDSAKLLGNILDKITEAGGFAASIAQGAGTFGKGAARFVGGTAAFTAAAVGVQQAVQAIQTGRSDVHDLLTSTETGIEVSDKIGAFINNVQAVFGNKEAQERFKQRSKYDTQQKLEEGLNRTRLMNLTKAERDAMKEQAEKAARIAAQTPPAPGNPTTQALQGMETNVSKQTGLQETQAEHLGTLVKKMDTLTTAITDQVTSLNLIHNSGQPRNFGGQ